VNSDAEVQLIKERWKDCDTTGMPWKD